MEQKKVPLPRKVAEALEKLGKIFPKDFILWRSSREDYPDAERDAWKTIHEFVDIPDAIFTLADALRYGYEPEPEPITIVITPEMQEQIKTWYEAHKDEAYSHYRKGFVAALNILGIEISEVNE